MRLLAHMPHPHPKKRVVLNSNTFCQDPHPPSKLLFALSWSLAVLFLLGALLDLQVKSLLKACEASPLMKYVLDTYLSNMGLLVHMPHPYFQSRAVLSSDTIWQDLHPPSKVFSTLARTLVVLFLLVASLGPKVKGLLASMH